MLNYISRIVYLTLNVLVSRRLRRKRRYFMAHGKHFYSHTEYTDLHRSTHRYHSRVSAIAECFQPDGARAKRLASLCILGEKKEKQSSAKVCEVCVRLCEFPLCLGRCHRSLLLEGVPHLKSSCINSLPVSVHTI